MEFDPVLLARIQFAFTISFHIIFPAFTIGLSAFWKAFVGHSTNCAKRHSRTAFNWYSLETCPKAVPAASGTAIKRKNHRA